MKAADVDAPATERKDAMTRTLPDKIVGVVEVLAGDLADWCIEGRDRTLAEHEAAILERVRRVLPLRLRRRSS